MLIDRDAKALPWVLIWLVAFGIVYPKAILPIIGILIFAMVFRFVLVLILAKGKLRG